MKLRYLGLIIVATMSVATVWSESPAFEGEIVLRNFRNYSDELLTLNPSVCNGVDTLSLIVKGNKSFIKDYRTQLVTICDPDTYIQYSLTDNTGIKCPYVSSELPVYNAVKTDQTRQILDRDVTLYVIEKNSNVGIELQAWVTSDNFSLPPFIVQTLNQGVKVEGLLLKYVFNVTGNMPMHVCQEILSITPRDVDDAEFELPGKVKIDEVKTYDNYKYRNKILGASEKFTPMPKELLRFSDFVNDFVQKHPASVAPAPTKTYDLDEDWDF